MRPTTLVLFTLVLVHPTAGRAGPQEDLVVACKRGNLEAATKALEAGAKPNVLDPDGGSAISAAFFWPEITKLLLEKGADPNLGKTKPVFQASLFYSTEVLKLLLDAGADPNLPTLIQASAVIRPLLAAERAKGAAANQALIGAWENVLKNPPPATPKYTLETTVYGTRCSPCIEMLLAKGAKIVKTADGNLLHAFANSFTASPAEWKKAWAQSKANIEAFGLRLPDWYGPTIPADRIGTPDNVVKLLVAKGVDVNEKNKGAPGIGPMTPLDVALNGGLGGRSDVMLALINNGAEVKGAHPVYGPRILQAAAAGFAEVVHAMVDKGADINTQGNLFTDGSNTALAKTFTPLTAAARMNRLEVVQYLIGAGASSNLSVSGQIVVLAAKHVGENQQLCVAEAKGKSAVFFAIENNNLEMVKFIVEHNGFDGKPYSFTAKKMTNCIGGGIYGPASWAKAAGASPELISYLQSKGL